MRISFPNQSCRNRTRGTFDKGSALLSLAIVMSTLLFAVVATVVVASRGQVNIPSLRTKANLRLLRPSMDFVRILERDGRLIDDGSGGVDMGEVRVELQKLFDILNSGGSVVGITDEVNRDAHLCIVLMQLIVDDSMNTYWALPVDDAGNGAASSGPNTFVGCGAASEFIALLGEANSLATTARVGRSYVVMAGFFHNDTLDPVSEIAGYHPGVRFYNPQIVPPDPSGTPTGT